MSGKTLQFGDVEVNKKKFHVELDLDDSDNSDDSNSE